MIFKASKPVWRKNIFLCHRVLIVFALSPINEWTPLDISFHRCLCTLDNRYSEYTVYVQCFSSVLFFSAFLQCTLDNRYSQYTTSSCTYPVQCFSPVCTVDNRYSAICKHRARIVSSVFSSAFLPTVDNRYSEYTVYVSCPVFALLQCCQGW